MRHKCLFLSVFVSLLFVATITNAATVTGKITYKGERPKLREVKMDADPICLTHHEGTVYPQPVTLGENFEMGFVTVHVVQGVPKKAYATPTEPVVLDQKGCMYTPPVFGAMVGQPVKILNPDGTLHNVHSLSKINPEFNIAMPKFRKEVTKQWDKSEIMFPIKCDVHPWMVTHGNIFNHPYFSITGEDGVFTIENLPAGEYTLEAIQQRLDPQQVTFTVTADETKEINFSFSRPDGK